MVEKPRGRGKSISKGIAMRKLVHAPFRAAEVSDTSGGIPELKLGKEARAHISRLRNQCLI